MSGRFVIPGVVDPYASLVLYQSQINQLGPLFRRSIVKDYGQSTDYAIGVVMKEAVRRAIEAIRARRFALEVRSKRGYDGRRTDIVTSADIAAQAVYLRVLRRSFPGIGVLAEENHLSVRCRDGSSRYFTVDPLDGSKAAERRQSHGIGTMLSLFKGNRIIGAYVGDVMTSEVYGFRPGSRKVYRISDFGRAELLKPNLRPLREQFVLLDGLASAYSAELWGRLGVAVRFSGAEIMRGSIGIRFARLWKGEVGGIVLRPAFETPWDSCPILGISQQMGFRFLKFHAGSGRFQPLPANAVRKVYYREEEMLVVHRKFAPLFLRG